MTKPTQRTGAEPLHISLVALPDGAVSTLYGIYDVMNAHALMGPKGLGMLAPFKTEIVAEHAGTVQLASGVPLDVQRAVDSIVATDVVIVPSIILCSSEWKKGRYPRLVAWLRAMHERGAVLCSACSGVYLIAETGLLDGKDATVHFEYERNFARAYPAVTVHPDRALVISGSRDELITSGASATWHDLVLYLIARYAGATAAQAVARMFALQWHQEGLTPFMVFKGKSDHGDAEIAAAQRWLSQNFAVASPVEEVIKRGKLAERTFKRRFTAATGLTPIAYVQRLRIEDAKRRLERTDAPVDEISWRVGYEEPAFFRRLFKRTIGMAPGAYRKRFQIPEYARP